ncbi:hypothetical protein Dda_1486 [Drechslerella dactyloides]|uniref:DUF6314 domain-containing protein n=1 Tax=Drechslerella dactyloides TaxID=74499 RepID=A0AAD6NN49_DREDA|nr:hypothetical protein Dda_1486 [Drechslerella dactyloides]
MKRAIIHDEFTIFWFRRGSDAGAHNGNVAILMARIAKERGIFAAFCRNLKLRPFRSLLSSSYSRQYLENMTRTVCIIGAGPSGLVAAKTLLHDAPVGNSFDVTIFDAQPRIGGLWPLRRDDNEGLVHPLMIANQSRHTMHYSDFAWPEDAPQIPRAWQVGGYLEQYRQRYCEAAKLRLGCRVEKADLVPSNTQGHSPSWNVRTKSSDGSLEDHTFDYLIVASGFFGQPYIPAAIENSKPGIPVVHSSKYRNLEQLLGDAKSSSGKILVVGGQLSGVEIAGTIASHISSAVNSPDSRRNDFIDQTTGKPKFSVHHIVQRPTWIVPLTLATNPASSTPSFLPLDLPYQNLSNRPPGPLTNTQGHISVEAAQFVNRVFHGILRTDQSEFSPLLTIKEEDYDQQPFLGASDTYLDFVRAGDITISRGKVESLSASVANIIPSGERIEDVAAVVLATGFGAAPSLSFFSEDIRKTLAEAPDDINNTVALAFHNSYHPTIQNLGFVGFYRSPYWGVMEMQSRFVTEMFCKEGENPVPLSLNMTAALEADDSIERTLALRTDPRASQFPMGDYPWLMQEFGKALDIPRTPHSSKMPTLPPHNLEMNVLTTARYPAKNLQDVQKKEVERCLKQTQDIIWASFRDGRFVSRAIFRSLLGEWKLERDLTSRRPGQPSGHFSGTAKFLLREGTADGREAEFATLEAEGGDRGFEYLYIEEGQFVDRSQGLRFNATRRYIWRYTEKDDRLSVWFVKTDDELRADYLFHGVEMVVPEDGQGENNADGWEAKGGHLCVKDFYNVKYNFKFEAVNLKEWRLAYTVNGPKKDYTIDGVYRR